MHRMHRNSNEDVAIARANAQRLGWLCTAYRVILYLHTTRQTLPIHVEASQVG